MRLQLNQAAGHVVDNLVKMFTTYNTLTPWLMEPGGSMPHSQGLSIPILSQINPIPRIDTYLFKVHSNILSS